MYHVSDLHSRFHGSVGLDELPTRNALFNILDIKYKEMSLESVGPTGICFHENSTVTFPSSNHLCNIGHSFVGGFTYLHHDLIAELLHGGSKNNVRMKNKIGKTQDSLSTRCCFGFGRCQNGITIGTWYFGKDKMPTISVSPFTSMPKSLCRLVM